MQSENSNKQQEKPSKGKKSGEFISIEKKISSCFARTIMICFIVLGVITSILSYISSTGLFLRRP